MPKKWYRFDGQIPMNVKMGARCTLFTPKKAYQLEEAELFSKKFTEVTAAEAKQLNGGAQEAAPVETEETEKPKTQGGKK